MLKLYTSIQSRIATIDRDDEGATMVEYGLMVGLIAVVCIVAVTALGTGIRGLFQDVVAAL
jgi:pilus assembly protein Flp/PilA